MEKLDSAAWIQLGFESMPAVYNSQFRTHSHKADFSASFRYSTDMFQKN